MGTTTKRANGASAAGRAKTNNKGVLATFVKKAADAVGNVIPTDSRRDAIELLKKDHDRVQALFEKVKSSDERRHSALFERIKKELDIHTHIEETIFYPNLRANGDSELVDLVLEGIEEHRQAKMFLSEIDALKNEGPKFEAKLKVLMEDIEHHVKDEEDEMFPLVKDQFSTEVLEDLAAEMEKEKRKFRKSLSAAAGH